MRRVLFIAYFYPPLANSGTQRPLKFANYLPDFGWEPLVLTVDRPPDAAVDQALLQEVRAGTRVTRVPILSDSIGRAAGRALSLVADPATVAGGIDWRLRTHIRHPDIYALWRVPAVRAGCRLFREIGFDAVWATGYPWTSLLAGRDVSRRTRRPLVADFRDPWSGEDLFEASFDEAAADRQRRAETSVLAQASAVTAVADRVTAELRSFAPRSHATFATITNGFDRADWSRVEPSPVPRRARVRIVYTGVWKDGYNLAALYEAISRLDRSGAITPRDLEVVCAGFAPGPAARVGVDAYVVEPGPIPHAEALGLMQSADLLFLPVGTGKRELTHLPGKLYEYAATERPIVAMSARGSEVERFLDEVGGGVVIEPGDIDGLAAALRRACSGTFTAPALRHERLQRYERRALAGDLAALLDRVSDPLRSPTYAIESPTRIVLKA